jgi:hypothetical protein
MASMPQSKDKIANWVKKQDLIICCLQHTHLTEKKTSKNHWLRVKGWKKVSK